MKKRKAPKVIGANEDEKIQYLIAQINQMRIEALLSRDSPEGVAAKERLDIMRRFLATKLMTQ